MIVLQTLINVLMLSIAEDGKTDLVLEDKYKRSWVENYLLARDGDADQKAVEDGYKDVIKATAVRDNIHVFHYIRPNYIHILFSLRSNLFGLCSNKLRFIANVSWPVLWETSCERKVD